MKIKIKIELIRENAKMPIRAHEKDAGFDCYISEFNQIYYIENINGINTKQFIKSKYSEYHIEPQGRIACRLGFKSEIPEGYYGQVVPRSGNAMWKGLTVTNSPGTIDAGYRGEWIAIVHNTGLESQKLKIGDKICQFIVKEMVDAELEKVDSLEDSKRGEKGFGSSGE